MTADVDRLFLDFQAAVAGRYSLERELGRGGMGVVYLAREVRLDRLVAIKVLPPARAVDAAVRERFLREARTAAKLSHPNIVPIHAVDDVQDFVFFAMAYVDGVTLAARVRERGPLPPGEATRVLRDVAWALGYAHGQGVVHRDVKPDNILLESGTGRALVADFGIAAAVQGAAGLDGERITGTPEFMAPEQALGESVDGRSDLYSLGVTAYFALSGRLPFTGANATEVLAKQVTEKPVPLADTGAAVPRKLAHVVQRCLSKARDERLATASEVADQLTVALERRKELPLALRAFVKHDSRLDGPGVLFYPSGLLITAGLLGSVLGASGAWITLAGGLTLAPAAVLVARARRVLRAGFDHADLDHAFKAEIEQGREERAFGGGTGASWVEVLLGSTSVLSILVMVLTLRSGGMIGGFAGLIGIGTGVTALNMLQRRRDVDAEFYSRIWTGPIGRWFFRIARWFTPRGAMPAAFTHRPTELSIGLAADQLFAKLDKATRQRLGDLPGAVRGLERDAQRMRARLDVLNDALAGAEEHTSSAPRAGRERIVAELTAERELVQQRLREAVAALETIRLGLLRLHAGTATVQSLTTDLGLARQVAREVDLLLDGRREVERLLVPTPDPERA
jgi:serine/threonine-protein kinase